MCENSQRQRWSINHGTPELLVQKSGPQKTAVAGNTVSEYGYDPFMRKLFGDRFKKNTEKNTTAVGVIDKY